MDRARKRKRSNGGGDNEDRSREPQASDEAMKCSCKLCSKEYNGTDRRPRVFPCGHSYCSLCISNLLVRNKIICPTCHKRHFANNVKDFPINYELENNLNPPTSSSDTVSQNGRSKILHTPRKEHLKKMQILETEVREKISNLQGFESRMNSWKEEHLHQMELLLSQMELLLSLVQKHSKMVTYINKESQTVKDTSGEANNILQSITTSVNDVDVPNKYNALIIAMEKSNNIYDTGDRSELSIRSQELMEESRILLKKGKSSPVDDHRHQDIATSSADENSAFDGESDKEVQFSNIQENIKNLFSSLEAIQEQFTSNNISDLKALTPYARSLIDSNKVFAVQRGKELRYAQITLDENEDICIHTLRNDVEIPRDAVLLPHRDVVGADIRPGLTFFDLTAEGRPLGRLRIRLYPERENIPLNFHLLCTGEKGPSYAHSGVLQVYSRGKDYEEVRMGDYERNDGVGGMFVVPGVDWREEKDRYVKSYAGALQVYCPVKENASQFVIYTDDPNDDLICGDIFGKLDDKESLNVLKSALNRYCHKRAKKEFCYTDENLKKIIVGDCGIILPRH